MMDEWIHLKEVMVKITKKNLYVTNLSHFVMLQLSGVPGFFIKDRPEVGICFYFSSLFYDYSYHFLQCLKTYGMVVINITCVL